MGSLRLLSLLLYPGFGALVREPPPVGVVGSISSSGRFSLSQRRRRKNFYHSSEKTQELRCNSRLPAPHVLGSPPPSVSLRVMAPSEFPRGRGLCPSGGACSPWGPVSRFWSALFRTLSNPLLYSDPEGRHVPCLGVCPFSATKGLATAPTGSTLQVAPSRARGPVGVGAGPSVVGSCPWLFRRNFGSGSRVPRGVAPCEWKRYAAFAIWIKTRAT